VQEDVSRLKIVERFTTMGTRTNKVHTSIATCNQQERLALGWMMAGTDMLGCVNPPVLAHAAGKGRVSLLWEV